MDRLTSARKEGLSTKVTAQLGLFLHAELGIPGKNGSQGPRPVDHDTALSESCHPYRGDVRGCTPHNVPQGEDGSIC
jgi:hypothetical protein